MSEPGGTKRLFGTLTLGGERNFLDTLRAENVGALLLLLASTIALIWASSPWRAGYEALVGLEVGPPLEGLRFTLSQLATDGLLAFFFFVVGLELKREIVDGELSSPRTAALPVVAALGGMVAPALIYLLVNAVAAGGEPNGWAVPTATDIAFAVAVISAFGRRLPTALRAFLLTLAVADDLGGIIIIATVFAHGLSWAWLATGVAGVALFGYLVRRRRRLPALLLVVAVLTWWVVHQSGIHATIAGVALGFTVPGIARPGEDEAVAATLEHTWRPFTAGLAVPLFAFFAVGVPIDLRTLAEAVTSPIGLGIILGLVVGKPIGIVGATLLAARAMGLRSRSSRLDLFAISVVAGIGFTIALLLNSLSFAGRDAEIGKAAILIASLLAAVLGTVLLSWRSRVRMRHAGDEVT